MAAAWTNNVSAEAMTKELMLHAVETTFMRLTFENERARRALCLCIEQLANPQLHPLASPSIQFGPTRRHSAEPAGAWTNNVCAEAMTKESMQHAVEATFNRLDFENERARRALCLCIEQSLANPQPHPLASPSIPFGPTRRQNAQPAGAQPGAPKHARDRVVRDRLPGSLKTGSQSRSSDNVRNRYLKPVRKSALPTRAPCFAEIEEVPMPLRQPGSAPKKRAWPRVDGARVSRVRPQAESNDSALVPPSEGLPPANDSASSFFPLASLLSPAPPSNSTIMMLPDVLTILQTKPHWLDSVSKMRVPSMIEALNLEPCAAKKRT